MVIQLVKEIAAIVKIPGVKSHSISNAFIQPYLYVCVESVVDKMALGQVCLRVLTFCPVSYQYKNVHIY
jgi:hypothetical protein